MAARKPKATWKGLRSPKRGQLLRVGWRDHFLLDGTWTDLSQDKTHEEALVWSYGLLLKDEPLYYTIAGSHVIMRAHEGLGNTQYGDVNRILKAGIFEIKEIRVR